MPTVQDNTGNNLQKIPVVSHTSTSGSIVLGVNGSTFPTQPFRITLVIGATYGVPGSESLTIFGVSAVATNTPISGQCTLTVTVIESSVDQNYTTTDFADVRLTAGTINDLATGIAAALTVGTSTGTANSLLGYNNSGVAADVTVGSGLTLSGGTLTSSGGGGSGTVTNIGTGFGVGGGPITTTGTLALLPTANNQPTIITPSLAAATNDWSPTGWLTATVQSANVIRVNVTSTTAATALLTGLVPPAAAEGCVVTIENLSTSILPLHFQANNTGSAAANRFGFPCDVWIVPGDSLTIIYDGTATQWRTYGKCPEFRSDIWGSGYDGVGPTVSTTFARDMFFTDWVIPAGQVFITAGYRIRCNGTLDFQNASAGSIINNGAAGTNGPAGTTGTATGGAGGVGTNGGAAPASLPTQTSGGVGGNGTTTAGTSGTAPTTHIICNSFVASSNGGAGGLGASGAGGSATNGNAATNGPFPLSFGQGFNFCSNGNVDVVFPGMAGTGGSGGGGDSTNGGGAGGGGGASAGTQDIAARCVYMGSNATAAIIQAKGGAGGNGGNGTLANSGGGGGAGGGDGGIIVVTHGGRFGSGGTNALDVTGGNGGTGGTKGGAGTGVQGSGGQSGRSGVALVNDLHSGAAPTVLVGVAKVASAGAPAGGVATVYQATL